VVLLLLVVAACGKSSSRGADAGPGFELTPPAGFRPAKPPGTLAAAWDGPELDNGFVPTLNVNVEARPGGTPEESYVGWRDHLQKTLAKRYLTVKLLSERELRAAGATGRLVILVCQLDIPGGQPMTIFVYAALFQADARQFTVGALTGASLDVASGEVQPIGEPQILAALATFKPR
jgi:hypothetical protein